MTLYRGYLSRSMFVILDYTFLKKNKRVIIVMPKGCFE